ncbi:MAG TPA: hypothetical protein VNR61_16355 [Niallia sp.]|nr:hypothetical protein [Niallia sp.]
MCKGIKIATIGRGSSYTPGLVEGFIIRYDGCLYGNYDWLI